MEEKPANMLIRMPADAKAWLAAQAKRNLSSQTSEAVRAVREKMQSEQATAR